MRKFIIAFLGFAALCSLSACDKNPPSLEDRVGANVGSQADTVTVTGDLEPIQISLYQEGTHQIKTETGKVVVVQSTKINLENYVGKSVTVKGVMQKQAHSGQEVLVVDTIQLSQGQSEALTDYQGSRWGFGFQYPSEWELVEGLDGVTLKSNGIETVKIVVSNMDTNLDDFVAAHEVEDGAMVTVGGQRSFRYTDGAKVRLYVPNASRKRVYRISFLGGESDQAAFYSLLENFTILEGKALGGDKCGGPENLTCAEGFRCELSGAEVDAEGACVPLEDVKDQPDCPFLAKPSGCVNVEARSIGKNGCPTSYVCADTPAQGGTSEPTPLPISSKPSADDVVAAFHKAQSGLLPAGAQIDQFEIVSEQDLLAVVYKLEDKKFRVLYSTASQDGGIEFNRLASFAEGDKRDWVLTDGKDVKITFDKKIITPGADLSVPKIVGADMRLYENLIKDFSMQYPKDWYYRSFGAIEGKIWAVGFSDKPFENYADSVIFLVIDKGESAGKQEVKSDRYRIETPRDATSHFVLNGPLGMKDQLDTMTKTLIQN